MVASQLQEFLVSGQDLELKLLVLPWLMICSQELFRENVTLLVLPALSVIVDTIDHSILLSYLCTGTLLQWFESYQWGLVSEGSIEYSCFGPWDFAGFHLIPQPI